MAFDKTSNGISNVAAFAASAIGPEAVAPRVKQLLELHLDTNSVTLTPRAKPALSL